MERNSSKNSKRVIGILYEWPQRWVLDEQSIVEFIKSKVNEDGSDAPYTVDIIIARAAQDDGQ